MNCPECKESDVPNIGEHHFCIQCEWDDLPVLPEEIKLTTPKTKTSRERHSQIEREVDQMLDALVEKIYLVPIVLIQCLDYDNAHVRRTQFILRANNQLEIAPEPQARHNLSVKFKRRTDGALSVFKFYYQTIGEEPIGLGRLAPIFVDPSFRNLLRPRRTSPDIVTCDDIDEIPTTSERSSTTRDSARGLLGLLQTIRRRRTHEEEQ